MHRSGMIWGTGKTKSPVDNFRKRVGGTIVAVTDQIGEPSIDYDLREDEAEEIYCCNSKFFSDLRLHFVPALCQRRLAALFFLC